MPRPLKSKVVIKCPTIIDKDLTRDNVWGWANKEDFEIELDKHQPSREYLNSCLHEMLHCILPDLHEKHITKMADIMSDVLWRRGFRRIKR
jgi:hypothetical protein